MKNRLKIVLYYSIISLEHDLLSNNIKGDSFHEKVF